MRTSIRFYECEHNGDMENYLVDLKDSGAVIGDWTIDEDEEVGTVYVVIEDVEKFKTKFAETVSYEFSSLA